MQEKIDENEVFAAVSAQRALLGVVTPNLRAVIVMTDSKSKQLKVSFFYDGVISEEIFDIASVAITEISADFPDYNLDDHIEQLDYPQKIPFEGRLIYLRKE